MFRRLLAVFSVFLVVAGARQSFPRFEQTDVVVAPYLTKYADVAIDHFDYASRRTFQLKYLVNETYFKPGGPLLFYSGNEGTIEGFAANTAVLFDVAPLVGGLIVFAEHRYYGAGSSLPFGDKSFFNSTYAKYLTVEQALADYVQLIEQLKSQYVLGKVISFGGSYGAMLSAWLRLKYPNVVDGAWAASAPLAYFRGSGVPLGGFDAVVTRTMETFGCNNASVIEAFNFLDFWPTDQASLDQLNNIFNVNQTTSKIESAADIQLLKAYIREGLEYLAMTGYPYPSNFLIPLKAWPMLDACASLNVTGQDRIAAANALNTAAQAYYGNTPACFKPACGDPATASLGALNGWLWQSCTELVIDVCAQGPPNDVFWPDCTDNPLMTLLPSFERFTKTSCQANHGEVHDFLASMIRFDAIKEQYGFDLDGASNIILTHGLLDPWSSGAARIGKDGLKWNIFDYKIGGAAHHLDLRIPNSCDPPSVTNARFQIYRILFCWVGQNTTYDCSPESLQWELPEWTGPTPTTDCHPTPNAYPWGQDPKNPPSTSTSTPSTSTLSTSTGSTGSTVSHSVSVSMSPSTPQSTTKGAGEMSTCAFIAALVTAVVCALTL
ncbi:CRE-PCP-1 protein [Aphelenchoides fujianensis]|nr:CRE-PCP-1 protein [Aphelenchoides fujianensis]